MFNTYSQNIEVNAVSGTLIKNYAKSFFRQFSMHGVTANNIFGSCPKLDGKNIVVIQCMVVPNDYYLAEIMWKSDFNKIFELEGDKDGR